MFCIEIESTYFVGVICIANFRPQLEYIDILDDTATNRFEFEFFFFNLFLKYSQIEFRMFLFEINRIGMVLRRLIWDRFEIVTIADKLICNLDLFKLI